VQQVLSLQIARPHTEKKTVCDYNKDYRGQFRKSYNEAKATKAGKELKAYSQTIPVMFTKHEERSTKATKADKHKQHATDTDIHKQAHGRTPIRITNLSGGADLAMPEGLHNEGREALCAQVVLSALRMLLGVPLGSGSPRVSGGIPEITCRSWWTTSTYPSWSFFVRA
jgi:hypothetical protein